MLNLKEKPNAFSKDLYYYKFAARDNNKAASSAEKAGAASIIVNALAGGFYAHYS